MDPVTQVLPAALTVLTIPAIFGLLVKWRDGWVGKQEPEQYPPLFQELEELDLKEPTTAHQLPLIVHQPFTVIDGGRAD